MSDDEVARVRKRDPQMMAEDVVKHGKEADLFSGRDTNSFLESHPLTHFSFSRRPSLPDDA